MLSEHDSVFPGQRQPRMREERPCPHGPIFLSRGKDNNHVLGMSRMVVYTDQVRVGPVVEGRSRSPNPSVPRASSRAVRTFINIIIHTAEAGLFYPLGNRREAALGKVL